MEGIPFLDLGIFSLLILLAIRGYQKGMIKQSVGIVAFVVALLIAAKYYLEVADLLTVYLLSSRIPQEMVNLLGFSLLVLLVILSINSIGYLLHLLSHIFFLSLLDNIGGALVGILKGVFILFILLIILSELPIPLFSSHINRSFFAKDLLGLTPYFKDTFFQIFQP